MQKSFGGLAAALLCVVWMTAGCNQKEPVMVSGLETHIVTVQTEGVTEQAAEVKEENTEEIPMYVDVGGAVNHPGVYPIQEGMRVFEVIDQAGGFRGDADTGWINQAETVHDGQKLYIYTFEETKQMSCGSEDEVLDSGAYSSGKVNLNSASKEQLMTLPGIGEAKAESIIQYRKEHGAFAAIEEVQEVPGIKEAVFLKLKDHITI